MPMDSDTIQWVSRDWLLRELRADASRLVTLDCRSSHDYAESHIRHAVNFSIPSIMLRRLGAGKIDLVSTIKCRDLRDRIASAYKDNVFVVYADDAGSPGETLQVVARRLKQDGCQVVCLEGELQRLRQLDVLEVLDAVAQRSARGSSEFTGALDITTQQDARPPARLRGARGGSAGRGAAWLPASLPARLPAWLRAASLQGRGRAHPTRYLFILFSAPHRRRLRELRGWDDAHNLLLPSRMSRAWRELGAARC